MEVLSAILLTGLGLFSGIFLFGKNALHKFSRETMS